MAESTTRLRQKTFRVLVVEDCLPVLGLLEHFLKQQGYKVTATRDAIHACTLALQEVPDLVLLDVNLSRRSGFDVARRLRENPRTASVAIVFMSGTRTSKDSLQASEVKADAYVEKPFRMEHLLTLVQGILKRRRASG